MDIFQAISNNDITLANGLIKSGTNINSKNTGGDTPLILATLSNNYEFVRLLINSGARIDAKNKEKLTPLQYSIMWNYFDISHLLIDSGANTNVKDNKGTTVLMEAIFKGNMKLTKKIINQNPDVTVVNKGGSSAIKRAVRFGLVEVAQLLLKHGAKLSEYDLFDAVESASVEMVEFLINCGIDPNTPKSSSGKTILMFAILKNNNEVAELLIKRGVALKLIDDEGKSALDYAKENQNTALVRYISSLTNL